MSAAIRNTWLVPAALAAASAAGLVLATQQDADAKTDPRVYDVRKKILGRSAGEWTADWWQWVWSMPASVHPSLDVTGEFAVVGQRGPLWFAGGGFSYPGSATNVVRTATIPAGRALLFPLQNVDWDNACIDPANVYTVAQMRNLAADYLATIDPTKMTFSIDGSPVKGLEKMRVSSPVFGYATPDDGVYSVTGQNCPGGVYSPAVSDGWWIFVKPLPPGPHVLVQSGDGTANTTVTYNLTVVDHDLP